MVALHGSTPEVRHRFPGGASICLLFNSGFVNFLLKANLGRHGRPNFVIFVVWSFIIVSGWVVELWSKKSYSEPVQNASIVFLVSLKNGGRRVSPRFDLFVSDVYQGNEQAG